MVDVGVSRVTDSTLGGRIMRDRAFEEVRRGAGAITPVPGGVGPMTVATGMADTLGLFLRVAGGHGAGGGASPGDPEPMRQG